MNYDLVIHLDRPEDSCLRMCLRNAANYLNALEGRNFELWLIANGGGVEHFVKKDSEFRKWAEELAARKLKIRVCANAMAEHGLSHAELWPMCEVVPAGLVALVELQERGFAYVKP